MTLLFGERESGRGGGRTGGHGARRRPSPFSKKFHIPLDLEVKDELPDEAEDDARIPVGEIIRIIVDEVETASSKHCEGRRQVRNVMDSSRLVRFIHRECFSGEHLDEVAEENAILDVLEEIGHES